MITNFQLEHSRASVNTRPGPQLKTDYAAGFRKCPQPAKNQNGQKPQPASLAEQVTAYVNELGIENLRHIYEQKLVQEQLQSTKSSRVKEAHHQEQAVQRLYKNAYSHKKQQQKSGQKQEKAKAEKNAADLWELDKKYQKEPQLYITRQELLKIHKKFQAQLQNAAKKQKYEDPIQFKRAFAAFLIEESGEIIRKLSNKSYVDCDYDDEIFTCWKGFLSTLRIKLINKKYSSQMINGNNLKKLAALSKYIFCLLDRQKIKENLNYNFVDLTNVMKNKLAIDIMKINEHFQISKSYTNPYQLKYDKIAKQRPSLDQQSQQTIERPVFKAKPIPKAIYQEPKQQKRPEPKVTECKPFKVAAQKPKIEAPPRQKYEFKANPLPETTYKPVKPKLMSEQEIKARALMSLQKACYPRTMSNLDKYQEEKQRQIQQINRRYQKQHKVLEPKPIPNFDYLHAIEIQRFQLITQQNKKQIKVQEFNLTVTKTKPQVCDDLHIANPVVRVYSPPKKNRYQSKSTKKFDSYINFRKQQQEERQKKSRQQEQQHRQYEEKQEKLRQILKQRVRQQLPATSQRGGDQGADMKYTRHKVDEQKIYRERPLLIGNRAPSNQITWETVL